jgi:hypothetical protein
MSLAPSFKFLAVVDSDGSDCPEVLSVGQILRMLGVMALLGLAITVLSLPSLLGL